MVILSDTTRASVLETFDHSASKPVDYASLPVPLPVTEPSSSLLSNFIEGVKELQDYRNGNSVNIDGQTLSIPAVVAVARHGASVELDKSQAVQERMAKSRAVITGKVTDGTSVYGVSTGFGGSANTRTDKPLLLGNALLQHQHAGVLPSNPGAISDTLPLSDPMSSLSMPESWVRGAIVIRMNSLIRGHSGVRPELIEKMNQLLTNNITPLVPLRGSISASGDLSPLSYIAGTIIGNPAIRVFDGPKNNRNVVSSKQALADHNISPLSLAAKEPLGILNGTAFSASVASLALSEAVQLCLLAQICTAIGTEALCGTSANYDPFIHDVCRPHPGQVEAAKNIRTLLAGSKLAETHEKEVHISQDEGTLRQDRYPLRTAPQFIGPQIEDLLASLATITQEINSTTDNPLIDGETGHVHHGGNFQAMAVTNAMEKTRLSLHHFGKLLFSQLTELINPAMNRGLPPNLAASDPSLDYHCKGIDIASAAYTAELGFLAHPVSTHIQSAEMHNQAVNSMALVSGRMTIQSIEVLSLLTSNYIYALCQALDLRAMHRELVDGMNEIIADELSSSFGSLLSEMDLRNLAVGVTRTMQSALERSSEADAQDRMQKVAASATTVIVDFLTGSVALDISTSASAFSSISAFRARIASRSTLLLNELRSAYVSGEKGKAPASHLLNKTRPVYEFVRIQLGISMHGKENFSLFENGLGVDDQSIGQNVALIHEAIRDGKMLSLLIDLYSP
ncbi:L-Aspartase-like protein [Flagelloscypha sp. PMI_526]|nr:L-Aspartase-like protein [Flagelloscypha sp. PMI_526]